MFIFEMQFVWLYLDELLGKDLGFFNIFKLLSYVSARLVNMALPLAILMSSIMTLGALGENNELTAMKSAGVSLFRILRPLILFSAIISITAFLFANNIWPIANLKFRTMLSAIMQAKPALSLNDGVFYNGITGISIRVAKNEKETGELTDVLIYDHRDGQKGNRTVIRAERGQMEQTKDKRFLFMTLHNGYSYDEQMDSRRKDAKYAHIEGKFEKMILRMDLSSLIFQGNSEELFKGSQEMMSLTQLDHAIDSLDARLDSVEVRMETVYWRSLHYPWREEARFKKLNNQSLRRDSIQNSDHQKQIAGDTSVKVITPVDSVLLARQDSLRRSDSLLFAEELSKIPVKDEMSDTYFFNDLSSKLKKRVLQSAKDVTRRNKEMFVSQRDEIEGRSKSIRKYKIEWHRKLYLAVICLVLFFIGAPLGAIIRKGGMGLPILLAIALFVVYHLLTVSGERMAKSGILEPWQGMWMSTLILMPLAIWLTYKAANDSVLLDRDAYTRVLRKIGQKLRLVEKPVKP
jgi:lipopolysaccharide export system permease protein